MTRIGRLRAEATAAARSFGRRRTAVVFTFLFPAILVGIFGALVTTRPGGGGVFAEPAGYYLPGYLATVVLFTPLSRIGSEIARHRSDRRFEKLATTPLSRAEWLAAHTAVNVAVVGAASLVVVGLVVLVTDARIPLAPRTLVVVPFVALGVVVFCGLGAVLGRVADSQDGVIAASNTVALPTLFLSDTFLTPELVPAWVVTAAGVSPLTYFARGVRAVTFVGGGPEPLGVVGNLAVLAVLAVAFFAAGAYAVPRTE
ncbi:MAG: ABC transporter permease [Halobaculum sp.]